jgi:hypothetical protein
LFFILVYLIEGWIKDLKNKKELLKFFVYSGLASLINPNFIKGTLQPLKIFEEYGYKIVENQSITFLENYGIFNYNFLQVKILIGLILILSVVQILIKKKETNWSIMIITFTFGILAWKMMRNFSLFGLVSVVFMGQTVSEMNEFFKNKNKKWILDYCLALFSVMLVGLVFFYNYDKLILLKNTRGVGLEKENLAAIDFIKKEKIPEPVFNNYDIGGYLIFGLKNEKKVFVDNRPESYSVNFLQNEYVAGQDNEERWRAIKEKYKFESIIFNHHDMTPWAQKFLKNRILDDEWQAIYIDKNVIIFLKNNEQNKKMITKYLIKKEYFLQ